MAPPPHRSVRKKRGARRRALVDAARIRELKNKLIELCGAQYQGKARELIEGLANDAAAVGALDRFERWCKRKGRASCLHDILIACIIAQRLARTFPKHITEAEQTLGSLERPREALAVLRTFLLKNKNKNWAVMWGNGAAIERGLDLLDYGIDTEKCVAQEAFTQFGATRKKQHKSAPRNAAIWALAEHVKSYTGRSHHGEVAGLASVIFGTTIDENIVKHAVRKRGPRFDAMQKKRAQRLLDSRLTGTDFERFRHSRE